MSNEPMITEEALKEELDKANSIQEAVEIMRSKGIDVTEEMLTSPTEPADELDESSLEDVAGGGPGASVAWLLIKFGWWYAKSRGWI